MTSRRAKIDTYKKKHGWGYRIYTMNALQAARDVDEPLRNIVDFKTRRRLSRAEAIERLATARGDPNRLNVSFGPKATDLVFAAQ